MYQVWAGLHASMTTIGFRDAGLGVVLFDVRKADVDFPTELEKATKQIETTRSKIEELNKGIRGAGEEGRCESGNLRKDGSGPRGRASRNADRETHIAASA